MGGREAHNWDAMLCRIFAGITMGNITDYYLQRTGNRCSKDSSL